jgi:hypothetical protein
MFNVGYNTLAVGGVGALVGHVYGSFAHVDKKVARLAFAAFFAAYNVFKDLPWVVTDPNTRPGFKSLTQTDQWKAMDAYQSRVKLLTTISNVTRPLSCLVATLAFRHFELIEKRGTVVMSLVSLYQVVRFTPTVQELEEYAAFILLVLKNVPLLLHNEGSK